MSTGPNPKNSPTQAGPGNAAPNPLEGLLRQLAAPWTGSLEAMSAWGEAWRSILQQRGAPASETMLKALNPAAWPGGITPLIDELEDLFALPHFADLPRLDASALPSAGPFLELITVTQQYLGAAAPVWVQVCQRFQAEVADRPIHLTPTEFNLLRTMAVAPGQVFSRADLIEKAFGYGFEGFERNVDVHITSLRRKLDAGGSRFIKTVYGLGYKIDLEAGPRA